MPKMKTTKAAAKRFKTTGTGKLKRNKAYKSHILTKKSQKRKCKEHEENPALHVIWTVGKVSLKKDYL